MEQSEKNFLGSHDRYLSTYSISCVLTHLLLWNLPLHIGRIFPAPHSCSGTLLHHSLSLSHHQMSHYFIITISIYMCYLFSKKLSHFSASYSPNSLLKRVTCLVYRIHETTIHMNFQNILCVQEFSSCPFLLIPSSKGNHYSDVFYCSLALSDLKLCISTSSVCTVVTAFTWYDVCNLFCCKYQQF